MKKIIKFLFVFALLFTLPSCSSDKFLLEGTYNAKESITIDKATLEGKINDKKNFLLLIGTEGCTSCEGFKTAALNPFIKDTSTDIYYVVGTALGSGENTLIGYSTSPTFIIFVKGNEVARKTYSAQDNFFKSKDEVKKFVEQYAILPKLYKISETDLDIKIAAKEEMVIYVGWKNCGDCKELYEVLLENYLKKLDGIMYYLEVHDYRDGRPSSKPNEGDTDYEIQLAKWENWIAFATKYNFVSYSNGKVPTFTYYDTNGFKSMSVYQNDKMDTGGYSSTVWDKETKTVTASFYEDLINKTFTSRAEWLKIHNEKITSYLDSIYR